MYIGIWTVLFIIVVFDARENRIPNKLVGLLTVVIIAHLYSFYGSVLSIPSDHLIGGLVGFSVCFALYLGGLVGAGDVKLIGSISLLIGLDDLLPYGAAVIVIGGIQSTFYLAQKLAMSQVSLGQHMRQYVTHNIYGRLTKAPVDAIEMRIPFAPAIVAAVALYPIMS